jgi:hypothetical protein
MYIHYKTSWLILFRDKIAVYSKHHMKHTLNILHGQNTEILTVTAFGMYSNNYTL